MSATDTASVLAAAADWLAAGEGVALAVVAKTWGSSPCPVGSRMAISASGRMAGSVSGGCVEAAVARAAGEVIATGRPRLLEFGVSDDQAWGAGLACGGRLTVFVEKLG
jgi:xanthine dehydrogenase accessory factor